MDNQTNYLADTPHSVKWKNSTVDSVEHILRYNQVANEEVILNLTLLASPPELRGTCVN